jgi:cyclic pyranopterin phosphate synthase
MDDRSQGPEAGRLSHLDRRGRPRMVDVGTKPATARRAIAEAVVAVAPETIDLVLRQGGPKGDLFTTAELAGIMAAKRTAELIPLCHPLPLSDVAVTVVADEAESTFQIWAQAATVAQTGVEMEALTAAAVAALTVYDMVKAVDRGAEIRLLRLLAKSGGRRGTWEREPGILAASQPVADRETDPSREERR